MNKTQNFPGSSWMKRGGNGGAAAWPAAPPVYRPQSHTPQAKISPPSVYRPAAALQAKTATPPVYRPQAPVQPARTAAPPVYRPAAVSQPKFGALPVSKDAPGRAKLAPAVLQRQAAPTYAPIPRPRVSVSTQASPPPIFAQRTVRGMAMIQGRGIVQRITKEGYIDERAGDPFLAMQDTGLKDKKWELMRHHIIPVKLLTDFFNTVKQRGHQNWHHHRGYRGTFTGMLKNIAAKGYGGGYQYTTMTSAMRTKQENALKSDEYKFLHSEKRKWTNVLQYGNLSQMGEFMKEVPTGPGRLNHELEAERFAETAMGVTEENTLDDKDSSSINLIISMYHWLPGNLFEGPKGRADDPTGEAKPENEQIDWRVKYIIGKAAYKTYDDTFTAMLKYVRHATGDTNDLADALVGYAKISERSAAYSYDPNNWEEDEAKGKPKIKVSDKA